MQLSLPHELTEAERIDLVREFVREQFVAAGMVADLVIHVPDERSDPRNHHAHILLTMRDITGQCFGKKNRDWNDKDRLEGWREAWAITQNRALERGGHGARVDHRSYADQGIDREAEPKQGRLATQMEKQGRESHAGNDRRAVKARNREREELDRKIEILDLEIERMKRALAEELRQEAQAEKPHDPAVAARLAEERRRQTEEQRAARERLNEKLRRDAEKKREAFAKEQVRERDLLQERLRYRKEREECALAAEEKRRFGGLRGLWRSGLRAIGLSSRERYRAEQEAFARKRERAEQTRAREAEAARGKLHEQQCEDHMRHERNLRDDAQILRARHAEAHAKDRADARDTILEEERRREGFRKLANDLRSMRRPRHRGRQRGHGRDDPGHDQER